MMNASRRIAASVHPAHSLGSILVNRLLLPAFVAHDALIMTTVGFFRLGGFPVFFHALLDQLFVTEHLPDDLLCLRFGSVVEFGHGGLLSLQTDSDPNVSFTAP